jgi:uncharacterized protein (TIGR02147 family)
MISVFNYTDYRKFLGDYYSEKKSLNSHFSYQVFADKAGIKSKTYLYRVISGSKNLAKCSVLKVAKAINLNYRETEYFTAIVDFNNAKSIKDKEFYFKKIKQLSPGISGHSLQSNQFDYFSKWYFVAIRELATMIDFKGNYKLLAKAVDPPITADQAEVAVQTLCALGLIKKMSSGKYCQTEAALTTDPNIFPFAVQLFQKECLNLASQSIENHNRAVRDISTLTVGISSSGFEQICQELTTCRKRIVEIVRNDNPVDRVYQINFQMFPVSKVTKEV